jgi:hypothetical protein
MLMLDLICNPTVEAMMPLPSSASDGYHTFGEQPLAIL